MVVGRGGGTITALLPTGWSWLVQNDQTDASDDTVSIIYKKADGSEGASLTWDMGFAIKGCAIAWRITGAEDPAIRAPEVASASFTTVANTADPPIITPTGGSKDYLFLAIASKDGTNTFTAAPSGYTNFVPGSGSTGGSATTNANAAGASKAATATSENPAVFTHGVASTGGRAHTIAIYPAVPRSYGVVSLPITFGKDVKGIAIPASAYKKAVVADGPAGYWRLDELSGSALPTVGSITLADQSTGGGTTGLLVNEPTSKGRQFIAANQSQMNGGPRPFVFNTVTWEVWVKRTRTNVYEVLIDQYNGGMRLAVAANGVINLEQSFGSIVANTVNLKLLDTNAHHVVVTRNGIGGAVIFYVDGIAEAGVSGPAFSFDVTTWANYNIFAGSTWGNSPFDGTLDELAIYSLILSQAQVQNHYDVATHVATTVFGSVAFPISFSAAVQGQRKGFGKLALPITFSKDINGQRKTFGQTNSPLIFGKSVAGQRKTFGQVVFPITASISTAGIKVGKILYGALAFPIIFAKEVQGVRKAFGQTAMPIVFSKDVKAVRKTFGQISFPIIFTEDVGGRQNVFGKLSMQTLFGKEVAGLRKTFGQLALPIIFSKSVAGQRKTFGQVAVPINVTIVTAGIARTRQYGQVSVPIIFSKEINAKRTTFGQITAPFLFSSFVRGERRTFSKLSFPIDFLVEVDTGLVGAHGKISLPIIISIGMDGKVKTKGMILNNADNIYLGTLPVIAVYVEEQKVWP
jgi:hypothetical protein